MIVIRRQNHPSPEELRGTLAQFPIVQNMLLAQRQYKDGPIERLHVIDGDQDLPLETLASLEKWVCPRLTARLMKFPKLFIVVKLE